MERESPSFFLKKSVLVKYIWEGKLRKAGVLIAGLSRAFLKVLIFRGGGQEVVFPRDVTYQEAHFSRTFTNTCDSRSVTHKHKCTSAHTPLPMLPGGPHLW